MIGQTGAVGASCLLSIVGCEYGDAGTDVWQIDRGGYIEIVYGVAIIEALDL